MNILITGGSSGLGESITKCLAASYPEANVFFTYNSSVENAESLEGQFKNTKALQLNFKNNESVDSIATKIPELCIDVLINNAVTSLTKNHFHKTNNEVFVNGFTENINPVLKITAAFLKAARVRKSGKIITVLSSITAGAPLTGWAAYTAEKNYLLSMAKSWAAENVQFNIQSNCISPEFMDTPLNKDFDIRLKEEMLKAHPLKRLLTTEEAAETVKFLITASPHINGQNIFLNNGKN